MRALIIDTDPGLDDAIAILFALHSGLFEMRGLTTVAGNIGIATVTRNAGRLLALMGRSDIPVVAGAIAPLTRAGLDELAIHGEDGLGDVPLPERAVLPQADAPGWLAKTLMAAPAGSIDLAAIGPLTNLAVLVRDHPEAARRLRRVEVMGGALYEPGNAGPFAEFNFASDPEAADIVLRAGLDLTLTPLDVTRRVRASRDYVARLAGGGTVAAATAAALAEVYFGGSFRESRPLHDPLAVLQLVRPDLFRVETRRLSVDLGEHAGRLVEGGPGAVPVRIALGVEAAGALDALAEGLGA
jgi:purine nucleosidase/pyrimidine-specific ribonucleoside hydrolase